MMWTNKISLINLVLFSFVIVCVGVLFFKTFFGTFELIPISKKDNVPKLPINPFKQSARCFETIGQYGLHLHYVPPKLQLPDLRSELIYYGKNGRPDLNGNQKEQLQITLKNTGETCVVYPREPIFLIYHSPNKTSVQTPSANSGPIWDGGGSFDLLQGYTLSPNNHPTTLWIEVNPLQSQTRDCVQITLGMLDENGHPINHPKECSKFLLKAEPTPKTNRLNRWDLDGIRVDSTLLVRQKARWVGPDLFLKIHGGEEFASVLGKERIDFHHIEDAPYSCFLGKEDFLIWKENRWRMPQEKDLTSDYPLLTIKRIEEKMLLFELWDIEGKGKTQLTLLKSKTSEKLPNLNQELKFVGAKTWAEFMVETPSGRMLMKANDWFVLKEEGWEKLTSPQAIDDYVEKRLSGPLFVLDKMIKQNGKQMLIGHLFNTMRTEMIPIELPAYQGMWRDSLEAQISGTISENNPTAFPPFNPNHEPRMSKSRKIAENLSHGKSGDFLENEDKRP